MLRDRSVHRPGASRVRVSLALVTVWLTVAAVRVGAAPMSLQPYDDPDKRFSISYPMGWQVKQFPSGATSFYMDDPEEGTLFTVSPSAAVKGEMDADLVLNSFLIDARKRYPDMKVVGERKRTIQGNANATIVEAALAWTNGHKVVMKGWAELGAVKQVGKGRTVISFVGYQAPTKDFDRVEPVFDRMLKSLKYGHGK